MAEFLWKDRQKFKVVLALESQGCHAGVAQSSLEQTKAWKAVHSKGFHQPQEAYAVTVIALSFDDNECLMCLT